MKLSLSTEKPDKECAVVKAQGEIDLDSSHILKSEIRGLLDAGYTLIVLDLGNVRFIDSSGLGALVVSLKAAAEHGSSIRLACAQPSVEKVLKLTGLDRVFIMGASVDEALA